MIPSSVWSMVFDVVMVFAFAWYPLCMTMSCVNDFDKSTLDDSSADA